MDELLAQSRAAHTAGRHLAGAKLAQQAVQLALCGVDEDLPRAFARAVESDRPLCVAMVDLDHFKA